QNRLHSPSPGQMCGTEVYWSYQTERLQKQWSRSWSHVEQFCRPASSLWIEQSSSSSVANSWRSSSLPHPSSAVHAARIVQNLHCKLVKAINGQRRARPLTVIRAQFHIVNRDAGLVKMCTLAFCLQ